MPAVSRAPSSAMQIGDTGTAMEVLDGEIGRLAGFFVFRDADGRRYAVRPTSLLALMDGDESQSTTCVLLPAGKVAVLDAPLDDVLRGLGP